MIKVDSIISKETEDTYKRMKWADPLAASLFAWDGGQSSLVVAIYGPWGSGKSSFKKLVEIALRKRDNDFIVKEFNPWMCHGIETMTESFFKVLDSAVAEQAGKDQQQVEKVKVQTRKELEGLKHAISRFPEAIKVAKGASKLAYMTAPVLALLFPDQAHNIFAASSTGLALQAIAENEEALEKDPLFKKDGVIDTFEEVSKASSEFLTKEKDGEEKQKESLAETNIRLQQLFKALPKKMLVAIDDIDRLTAREIRMLFQMLKANSDFPNLIFMLMCDRVYVEHCLAEVLPERLNELLPTGQRYMDKIVHFSFTLPAYSLEQIRIDSSSLYEFLASTVPGTDRKVFDETISFLGPYMLTPRNIIRYDSAVRLKVEFMRAGGFVIPHIRDLLILEGFRIFESGLHDQIAENEKGLLGSDPRSVTNELEKCVRENRKLLIRHLLQSLFPFPGQRNPNEPRRIYDQAVFNAYFFGI